MSSELRLGYAVTSGLAALLISISANADPVTWDTASAIAAGNGCNSTGPFPDAFFITAGDDLSVIFMGMGVDLTPETAANSGVTGCLVRVPVTFDGATAVTELDQTLLWGYAKDFGTTAQVMARSTLCSLPTTPISSTVDASIEGVQALIESSTQSFFTWPPAPPFCQGQAVTCMFQANIAVAARRNLETQDISIRIFGEDIQYEVLASWAIC
jgi:hypothetical protein